MPNINKIYNYSINDVKIVSLLNYKKMNEKKCKRCGIYGHNELQCNENMMPKLLKITNKIY